MTELNVTVHLLTNKQMHERYPEFFSEDPDYEAFNELPPTGNSEWLDYEPEQVLVVLNKEGGVVAAQPAHSWWIDSCGFEAEDE